MSHGLAWSLDSLALRGTTLFGVGWAFHPDVDIVALTVVLTNDRETNCIAADFGKQRDDVAHAHPKCPSALHSGFIVIGELSSATAIDNVTLEATLSNGQVVHQVISHHQLQHLDASPSTAKPPLLRQATGLIWAGQRGFHLLRTGQFSAFVEKVRLHIRSKPKTALTQPKELRKLLANKSAGKGSFLIIDHDLGGGANLYRNKLVEEIVSSGGIALIFSFHVLTLQFMLIIRSPMTDTRVAVPSKAFLFEALQGFPLQEIVYNTAVSFVKPEEIPQLLCSIAASTGARIKVLLHDFYVACPSHFLLNQHNEHCRLPDTAVCNGCLAANEQGFVRLFAARDISVWRANWGQLLLNAAEVVAFSQSTVDLVQRAYPQLPRSRFKVVPHTVAHLPSKVPQLQHIRDLHIGVVGQIGLHKGAYVVRALEQEIRWRKIPIRITVIGSLEVHCNSDIVSQTGSYQHGDLPRLIEESGANVMLFPSVWPETFSYVVQELIEMQLPIVCFDLGAPVERLAAYPKGLIINLQKDARAILDELLAFHHQIYLNETT